MAVRGAGATPLMAVLYMLAAAWMVQLTTVSAAFQRPEGGADGIYEFSVVVVDGVEQQQVKYLGEANRTVGGWAANHVGHHKSAGGGGGGRKLLADSGVHCQWNAVMNNNNVAGAITGLANYFGSGISWYSNIGVYYGDAVAFACNYGGTQYTTSGGVWSDQNAISYNGCADYVGGWYSHESWKSSFGRTVNGWGFC